MESVYRPGLRALRSRVPGHASGKVGAVTCFSALRTRVPGDASGKVTVWDVGLDMNRG